jgi:hypothetical protein
MEMESTKPISRTKTRSSVTLSTTNRKRTGPHRLRHGTIRQNQNCKVPQSMGNTTQTLKLLPLAVTKTAVF